MFVTFGQFSGNFQKYWGEQHSSNVGLLFLTAEIDNNIKDQGFITFVYCIQHIGVLKNKETFDFQHIYCYYFIFEYGNASVHIRLYRVSYSHWALAFRLC